MKSFYDIKNVFSSDFTNGMVKDFDFKSRTVTGYFSSFGNVDHDKDMMMPGSLVKTISERGANPKNGIPHLADHWMDTTNLLAKPILTEQKDGGYFESTVTDTTKGLDILKQYRDGLINNHSFGYKVLRSEDKSGYREIKEILLFEISTVVLGASDNTPFTGFKSLQKPQLLERYNRLQKCFRDGDYSDEFFDVLKAQIKQIEQDMLGLFIKEQQNTETTAPTLTNVTQPEVDAESINKIYNLTNWDDNGTRTLKKVGEKCGKL